MRKSIILFIGLFTLSFQLLAQPEKGKSIDRVIAVVADEIILQSDLENQYTQYARANKNVGKNARCIVFEELLYQKLLLHQAEVDSIEVKEEQVKSEINRRIQYFVNQVGGEEELVKFFGKSIPEIKAEFHDLVKDQLLSQQMQAKITENVKVTPKEVRQFYNGIPKDSLPFINAEVEVAHIVIEPEINEDEKKRVKEKLAGFRKRILKGEDFGTLAYLYSEDPGSAKKNGELGFMKRGMLVPEFAAAGFSLEPGQVSEIVETKYGFHIIQMIERKGQQANMRHILLKPKVLPQDLLKSKTKLDSIYKLIKEVDTVTFEKMVMKFSDDKDTKMNQGKLVNPAMGTSRFEMDMLSQVDPTMFFVLDKMKPGDISEPVLYQKPDGTKAYRLVKLVLATEPHRANLKDDYQRIQNVATAEKEKKQVEEWIQKRIRSNYIKINDDFVDCEFQHNWFN